MTDEVSTVETDGCLLDEAAPTLEETPALGAVDFDRYLAQLRATDHDLCRILARSGDLESARDAIYAHLANVERRLFDVKADLHELERATVREALRAFRSIIGPVNEESTGTSTLDTLWKVLSGRFGELAEPVSEGFMEEILHLFLALAGRSGIYEEEQDGLSRLFLEMRGREAALVRTEALDEIALRVKEYSDRYPSGLDEGVIERRAGNRDRILEYMKAGPEQWEDWDWHVQNVVKDPQVLSDLVELTAEQQGAVERAVENRIPFGVTPYYLSLMDRELASGDDHAVRAQVIPPPEYVDMLAAHKNDREFALDFMGEHDTSHVDLVTRRYPVICILKPYNTCSQVCVYCQRNWEIDECLAPEAKAPDRVIEEALAWLDEHPGVGEVLVTGGDPAVMSDQAIDKLLGSLANKPQLYRIRLGTRTPVVLPHRWTPELMEILARYHEPGRREVCVVTHFAHAYEITPESMRAVQAIRKTGIGVYNQQVFTMENARRFESTRLRRLLRSIGVDPYYTFNMKGKEETRKYMVPIARLLQERKEEARLLPGMDRTDEPVFNVPRLGKNHLRAWQDHRLIMIRPDGSRVYEFHAWEKHLSLVPPYIYTDVPIADFLREMEARGESPEEYRTIWYYY